MKLLLIFHILFALSCASYKSNQKYSVKKDIKYGTHDRHMGDLYLSQSTGQPIVVVVHGGGWSGRSKSDMDTIAESLASHGYNVFNINYRLAPEFKHPAPIDDLEQAIKFLEKEYASKIDMNKLGLWGYSAGSHIITYYGLARENRVKAMVAGGAPLDLTWWPYSPIVTPYMGYKMFDNVQGWLEASPVHYLKKGAPPIFMYHGIEDNLVEHSQMTAFDAKARLLGVETEMHHVSFWGHINTFVWSSESVEKGIKFLKRKL